MQILLPAGLGRGLRHFFLLNKIPVMVMLMVLGPHFEWYFE